MDPIQVITQSVNPMAVALAWVATQILKYFLPSPTPDRTTEVEAGKLWTRLLPLFPLVAGMTSCYFLEAKDWRPTADIAVRGVMSGALASYLYRTYKVSILGE